jgi:hypothetical protein
MADPVDIFGSSPDLPPEMGGGEAPKDDEEEGKGAGDEKGEDEGDDKDDKKGGDDKGDDDGGDDEEIDLEKETDPEKLRKAALRYKNSSDVKSESIRNLRRSRREGKVDNGGQASSFEAPWKGEDITYSKDLPKEVRDKMTDNERKLHDDLVKVREQLNTDAKGRFDTEEAKKKEGFNPDVVLDDEIEDVAKEEALVMAKGDRKKANEIIKQFNKFNNSGLTEAQLIERLDDAARLAGVSASKAPKDQTQMKNGKPVKKSASDPYGVNAIVESVASSGVKQNYSL